MYRHSESISREVCIVKRFKVSTKVSFVYGIETNKYQFKFIARKQSVIRTATIILRYCAEYRIENKTGEKKCSQWLKHSGFRPRDTWTTEILYNFVFGVVRGLVRNDGDTSISLFSFIDFKHDNEYSSA